jgi:hypothetical protein
LPSSLCCRSHRTHFRGKHKQLQAIHIRPWKSRAAQSEGKSTADEDREAIPREAQELRSKKEREHKPHKAAREDVAGAASEEQNHLPFDDAQSIINNKEN